MLRGSLTVVLAFSASSCAYYPDLYSIDTSQLRARACASDAILDPVSSKKFNESCTGTSESSSQNKSPISVEYETEETRTTQRTVPSGEASDKVEETEWVETKRTPIPFETYESVVARTSRLTPLEMAIVKASWLQDKYEQGYRDVSKIRDILEVPVIVAAGAAGLVAVDGGFFEKGNQTSRLAEIGVIGLTYSAGKDALTSPNMAEYYIRGHGALNCAIAIGMPFTTAGNSHSHSAFNFAVKEQRNAIVLIEKLFAVVSIDDPDSDQASNEAAKKVLESARQLARTTLVAARTARNGALGELAAFNGATTMFQLEVSEISVLVASKGQVRTAADYTTISGGFNQTAEAPPEAPSDKGVGMLVGDTEFDLLKQAAATSGVDLGDLRAGTISHADLAALTGALVEILLSRTSDLTGYSPGYVAAITKLGACSGNVALPTS